MEWSGQPYFPLPQKVYHDEHVKTKSIEGKTAMVGKKGERSVWQESMQECTADRSWKVISLPDGDQL